MMEIAYGHCIYAQGKVITKKLMKLMTKRRYLNLLTLKESRNRISERYLKCIRYSLKN